MYFSRNLKRADHLLRRWAEEPIGVAVPFLAFLAVWLPPQMPDMFAGMEFSGNEADPLLRPFLFAVSATLLGLSAWFWTRAALTAQREHGELDKVRIARGRGNGHPDTVTAGEERRRRADSSSDHEDWSHEWAPRIALLAAGGITLLPILFFLDGERLLNSPLDSSMLVLVGMELLSFGLVGLLFVFVVHRTRFRWIGAFDAPAWMKRHRFTRIMAFAPFGWPFAIFSLACSFGALACVIFRPEWVTRLDAPTAAIASLAFAVGPLVIVLALFRGAVERSFQLAHIVSHRGRMQAMIPGERHRVKRLSNALGTIAMLAWFLSPPWVMEKHPVPLAEARIIEPPGPGDCNPTVSDDSASVACRPDLETALRTWVASRRPGAMSEQRLPVIIVAAEGGASRAAAWLLSSLRMLDHQTGGEAGRHLFAISGVSGGSLGAISHLRLVAAHADADGRLDWDKPEVQDALSAIATSDLLSATISTYFLSDMFGSMVGPLWTWSRVPDRNAALERSFDLLWQRGDGFRLPEGVPSTLVGLHAAMAERRVGQASLPHVILNGSDVSTGRRILTSSIRTTANLDYFPDSGDFIKLTTHDISLATAVTNSARFPFVSPAGSFWSVTERKGYQIVDGGYFENYGARTAWELARAIEDLNAKDPSLNVVPVVVIVSNDLEAHQRSAVCRGRYIPHLGDTREDGTQITVHCNEPISASPMVKVSGCDCALPSLLSRDRDHGCRLRCLFENVGLISECSHLGLGVRSPREQERSLVPQSLAPFLGLASTRSSHGRDALNIVKRDFCSVPTPSKDVPATRMFHIALPIPATAPSNQGNKVPQSAPMNWVLNPHACNYMMNVAPWIAFNRSQAMKLEATMAAIERRTPAKARTDVPSLDCGLGNAKSGQKPRLIAGIP